MGCRQHKIVIDLKLIWRKLIPMVYNELKEEIHAPGQLPSPGNVGIAASLSNPKMSPNSSRPIHDIPYLYIWPWLDDRLHDTHLLAISP